MSQEHTDERESLDRLLDDLEHAQQFSVIGSLAVLTRATIGIDDHLCALDAKVGCGFEAVDQRFDAVDRRFDAMDQRFDTMDRRFDTMDKQFGLLADDVRQIGASVERLTGYITRAELKGAV